MTHFTKIQQGIVPIKEYIMPTAQGLSKKAHIVICFPTKQ